MDCKLVRAAHRHRQLTLNQLDRHRASAGKIRYVSDSTPLSRQRPVKAHQHQRAIIIFDDNEPSVPLLSSSSPSHPSPTEKAQTSPAISLADVMVQKPTRKSFQDSFELICQPISRVIVLPDDDDDDEITKINFPSLKQAQKPLDDEWERIGMDGEIESASEPEKKKSWLEALLGNS